MTYQEIPLLVDPIVFSIGFFSLRWYSLAYLVSFLLIYLLLRRWAKSVKLSKKDIDDLFFWAIVGLMIGARLGYVLFYNLDYFAANPLEIIWPFSNGKLVGFQGLSFHGGLVGIILAAWIFCKKKKISFLQTANLVVPAVPIGLFFGRLGNFANGELYGRVTDSHFGMRFSSDPMNLRHPSQLYEALGEGLFLFIILLIARKNEKLKNHLLELFFILYGIIRFCLEFFRQPDAHLGFIFSNLSMGQVLCLAMVVVGVVLYFLRSRKT